MDNDTVIEFRLDTYGDDLDQCVKMDGLEFIADDVKKHVIAGQDIGIIEKLVDILNEDQREKHGPDYKQLRPTAFTVYRARLVFLNSANVEGRTCQNFLVRTSTLAKELKKFPNNAKLKALAESEDAEPVIRARIWASMDHEQYTENLGLLLGMTGPQFAEQMERGAKEFDQRIVISGAPKQTH